MSAWPPIRGDAKNQLERFTLAGVTGTWSDRGKLYGAITATKVELYKDQDHGTLVADGLHSSGADFAKVTLAVSGGSGISGTCYIDYQEADSEWVVYPLLAVDEDINSAYIDFTRWPKEAGETTREKQHIRTRQEFVRLMRNRIPPSPGADYIATGIVRGARLGPWLVNSKGDFELKYLHNVEDYREWAIQYTAFHTMRTVSPVLEDVDQVRMVEGAQALADKAWSEVIPLYDDDADMDADREGQRHKISRG